VSNFYNEKTFRTKQWNSENFLSFDTAKIGNRQPLADAKSQKNTSLYIRFKIVIFPPRISTVLKNVKWCSIRPATRFWAKWWVEKSPAIGWKSQMYANLCSGEPMQAEVECVNQTVENESENRKGGIAIFSEVKCRFPPSRKLFFWRNPRSLHYFRGCSPFPPALGNDGV